MQDKITVFLEPLDADKFLLFQKHYDLFTELENHGMFKMKFGKVILNIASGKIQNIVKEEMVWRLQ